MNENEFANISYSKPTDMIYENIDEENVGTDYDYEPQPKK